jgi:hypothetical protein
MRWREPLEWIVLFGVAVVVVWSSGSVGEGARQGMLWGIAAWAAVKTGYYYAENLRHIQEATASDLAYHRFLMLLAYNMAQITISYALDFFCLEQIDHDSLSGIPHELQGAALLFECFYFSVLNFSFFGYGDITPQNIPAKIVMLMEVITAFATVIFLLSDFVAMKDSMRRKQV